MAGPILLTDGLRFPEGPAFAPDGALWGVELNGGSLFRWADGHLYRVEVGGRPNGLAFHDGGLFFCDAGQDSVRRLDGADPSTGAGMTAAQNGPASRLTAPNDLAFSPTGAMVFTCPGDSRSEPTGTVWVRDHGDTLRCLAGGLMFPNGLAFTPDRRELIVAETFRQRLWRGGWDDDNRLWTDPAPWIEVGGPIGPDGMAFGPDGRLYVALYGQGQIAAVDLNGQVQGTITVPGPRPTNLAFDPCGALGMVVTEAERGLLLAYPDVGRP